MYGSLVCYRSELQYSHTDGIAIEPDMGVVPFLSFPEEISMHGLEYGDEAEPPVNQAIAVSLHNY